MAEAVCERKINKGWFQKGMIVSQEIRQKMMGRTPWNKGLKIQLNTGRTHFKKGQNLGVPRTEEVKQKLSIINTGKHHTEATKKKLSIVKMGVKYPNRKSPPPFTAEHRKKLSDRNWMKNLTGEKNPNWKGGKSFEPYPTGWIKSFKESIRERDNHTCYLCKILENNLIDYYKKLDIHHIDYNKQNLNPKNLISLCRKCHLKTNSKREYWKNYFIIKLKII